MTKPFDHGRLDDTQAAFLTRLRRMHLLVLKIADTASERNELLMPILPFLHPTHRDNIVGNAEEFGDQMGDMGEVLKLMSEDIEEMGSVVLEHMKYLEGLVDEIKEENEE